MPSHLLKSLIVPLVALLLSCARTQPIQNEIMLDGSPDEVFDSLVNRFVAEGFETPEISNGDRTFKTSFKEVSTPEFRKAAKPSEEISRYSKGRYAYLVRVESGDGGSSRVHVEAVVEGYYRRLQQESETFGTTQDWKPEPSTGQLEEKLIRSLMAK